MHILKFATLIAAAVIATAGADKQSKNRADCTDPCTCMARIDVALNRLEGAMPQTLQKIASNAAYMSELQMAAGSTDAELAKLVQPLLAVAIDVQQDATTDLPTASKTISETLNALTQRKALFEAIKKLSGTYDGSIITKTSGHFGTAQYTAAPIVAVQREPCPKLSGTEEYTYDELNFDHGQGIGLPQLAIELDQACYKNTEGTPCDANDGSDKLKTKIKFGTKHGPAGTSPLANGRFATTVQGTINLSNETAADNKKKLSKAAAADAKLTNIPDLSKRETYTSHPAFSLLVNRLLMSTAPTVEITGQVATATEAFINKNYGSDQEQFKAKIWDKIKTATTVYYENKAKKTKKVSALSGDQKVTALPAAFFKEQKETTTTKKETAEDAPKKTDTEDKKGEKKDGDKTSGESFSSYQTKDACEAVNKDGKKHCGWKRKVIATPKRIKKPAQTVVFSSIKKLALCVAAAFVSILVF
ncbi:variant surface glycoprotein (VSG, atypical), putative [Trypanosoma brucei brucei TREU927]|uniref:Variant surface glycoprotein (VSG, atypical), putative n=1 Tax=Trypanosoma brucei brucei (strain 927/4 GUTat10.1) TaxID=185431 RepID=Q57X39_TRYB2|nr:variant surface glycoprotein (VSG, atypical), putative [Trypanosoma brucei brucei TREU927]AAX69820.1 variant surface glycoprotein (VSG, atypical), putative [Trypanosoma brucei]AAZ11576.1 variant surface glycoprotein (VSG, atypical), putative [Trypanosoma brucei brucei TREU927]